MWGDTAFLAHRRTERCRTWKRTRKHGKSKVTGVVSDRSCIGMIRDATRNQKLGWALFILYLIFLTYFMFFAEALGRGGNGKTGYAYNLELFKEIRRFYVYRKQLGRKAVILNLWGNVAGFLPFGFFFPVISKRGRTWYRTCLLGFLLSLAIEATQLAFRVGSFDVDDLLLNTIGGILGFFCYRWVQKIRVRRKLGAEKDRKPKGYQG